MKRIFLFSILLFLGVKKTFAQLPTQEIYWNSRMPWFTMIHFNPAYSGVNHDNLLLGYRKQFVNTPGILSWSLQGAYDVTKNKSNDVGGTIKINQEGNNTQVLLRGVYGYRLDASDFSLGLGVAPSVQLLSLSAGINSETRSSSDLDAGLWFRTKNVHVGAAVQNLFQPIIAFKRLGNYATARSINANVGWTSSMSGGWKNKSEVFYRICNRSYGIQFATRFEYLDKFQFGLAYRMFQYKGMLTVIPYGLNPISIMTGFDLGNQIQLRASYDFPVRTGTMGGNLEFGLNIKLKDYKDGY